MLARPYDGGAFAFVAGVKSYNIINADGSPYRLSLPFGDYLSTVNGEWSK